MTESVFHRLRKQLDQYSIGFPATESGVEIRILKALFSEKEAGLFTKLTAGLESPDTIAQRLGVSTQEIASQLESMARKGLVFRKRDNGLTRYSAIPFIHGILEFQINRMDKKLIGLVGSYINEKLHLNLSNGSKSFLRTIPVQQSVQPTNYVAPYNDAGEILRQAELIVVTPCACREQVALFDKDCDKPKEVCFMFGPMGQYYLENNMGRKVDLDEALEILLMAHEAGLVTQPASAQKPFTICNCCGCCCGFLRPVNKLPNPADYVSSNYWAKVEQDKCSGCETCLERCPMHAIRMNDHGCSQIDPARCIGCGLCVTTCPENAIELMLKPKDKCVAPPLDTAEQMRLLSRKRGKDEDQIVSFGFNE